MAWVDPTDVSAGSVLTASKWNQEVVENTTVLRALANVVQDVETAASTASLNADTYTGDLLAVTITPTAATSKVLITCSINVSVTAGVVGHISLFKGGTIVGGATGDAAGSRSRITAATSTGNTAGWVTTGFQYLDSPATTSATTYSVRLRHGSSIARTYFYNRSETDTDNATFPRGASFLTAQEIPV